MGEIICPHCKSNRGFYVRETVRGSATVLYTNNGDYSNDQSAMYDGLMHRGGKNAYCVRCHKQIGKSANLISGNIERD